VCKYYDHMTVTYRNALGTVEKAYHHHHHHHHHQQLNNKIIARSNEAGGKSENQVRLWQVKEKCLKTLSEYRERRCRCNVWWKTVPEVGAGNWKSPFSDGGKIERRTASSLEEADRSLCRDGTSVTRVKYDDHMDHMYLHQAMNGVIILDIMYSSAHVNQTYESHHSGVGLS